MYIHIYIIIHTHIYKYIYIYIYVYTYVYVCESMCTDDVLHVQHGFWYAGETCEQLQWKQRLPRRRPYMNRGTQLDDKGIWKYSRHIKYKVSLSLSHCAPLLKNARLRWAYVAGAAHIRQTLGSASVEKKTDLRSIFRYSDSITPNWLPRPAASWSHWTEVIQYGRP